MTEEGFLSEVLKSKEETLVIDLKETIPAITSKIERLRFDTKSFILDGNGIKAHVNVPNNFLKQLTVLNTDMKELDEKISTVSKQKIKETILDITNLTYELNKTKYSLNLANSFIIFHEKYKEFCKMVKDKKYVDAVQHLAETNDIIKEIPLEENFDVIHSMKIDIALKKKIILERITDIWYQAVKFEVKNEENIQTVKIAIDNITYDLEKIIKALSYVHSTIQFDCLADFLLNSVLSPIINNNVEMLLHNGGTHEFIELRIKINSSKMQHDLAFENLSIVFEYLYCKIDYELKENLTLVGHIGNRIRDKFCIMLTKNYLKDIVPSTEEEYVACKNMVKRLEDLTLQWKRNGFFDEQSHNQLLEGIANIEVAYADKISQNYMAKAITIFKKDLHDMIEVGVVTNQSDENEIRNLFANCYVSQSTCEVLDLLTIILDHAATSSNVCASKLFNISKHILADYCVLIPTYHKKLLDTIPQQSALFYNNCMYLSHQLVNNEQFYGSKFSQASFAEENFDFQIKYLQTTGTRAFTKVIQSHKKQIEEILNESDLASLSKVEELDRKCNKSIRQCLRVLEVLKTVWQKVLSYKIYNKSIGDLLNSFIERCIKLVLETEDISTANCNLLVEIFQVVQTRGPTLFSEPKEIHMYAKSWNKFKELIILLSSSLSSIDDRWADGKGALAHEFAPADVRKLIQALFKNTDHRAAVLAQIYK